jgi:hypothetical protein
MILEKEFVTSRKKMYAVFVVRKLMPAFTLLPASGSGEKV